MCKVPFMLMKYHFQLQVLITWVPEHNTAYTSPLHGGCQPDTDNTAGLLDSGAWPDTPESD